MQCRYLRTDARRRGIDLAFRHVDFTSTAHTEIVAVNQQIFGVVNTVGDFEIPGDVAEANTCW